MIGIGGKDGGFGGVCVGGGLHLAGDGNGWNALCKV